MYSTNWMAKWIEGGAITVKLVRGKCWFLGIIQCGASGPATSTRIALQILLNIPVLGRGVINCIVSPRIKDLRSQRCFLSLPPSITVVSEKDNLFNNNNKNFKYDSTLLMEMVTVRHVADWNGYRATCCWWKWLPCDMLLIEMATMRHVADWNGYCATCCWWKWLPCDMLLM